MIVVEGGVPLRGEVPTSGAKNAALPALIASLLIDEPLRFRRIPRIADVETTVALIETVGKRVRWEGDAIEVGSGGLSNRAPDHLVQKMRASFIALGPLLARCGEAWMPLPGGCAIGPRPVDLHLGGLARMGARIELVDGVVHAQGRLRGATIWLDYPSVGATEHLLLAGALAEGTTTIVNPAREPEVVDLTDLLQKMGAQVRWEPDRVTIHGQPKLHGAEHEVIPDRIEAGTYLLAGAITRGRVTVTGAEPQHLEALRQKLRDAGAQVEVGADCITVDARGRGLRAVEATTWPYPGFPTDLQSPLTALLTLAEGTSRVRETVFPARWGHVDGLRAMGAQIRVEDDTAVIEGVERLRGAEVEATDLRAGAALVLAALAAHGESKVHGEEHVARGYENLLGKLHALGAQVWARTFSRPLRTT